MTLDWLIIGGGIHGVHIAARLIGEGGVAPDRVRIVDPARLLARWRACRRATGMTHLRSPSVHHLELDPWSLRRFAGKRKRRRPGLFAYPYDRPALELFNAHCDRVVEAFALDRLHIPDRAVACSVACDRAVVRLANEGELDARRVVLAVGASEQPEWPAWAPRRHPRVRHIFEPGFDGWPSPHETVAVVGGGISAGQVALRLSEQGRRVHLISRHRLRQRQFDSDAGWLGPKLMVRFERERDLDRRRAMIRKARHLGSVPPDTRYALLRAIAQDRVSWHEAEIDDVTVGCSGVRFHLCNGDVVDVERVLLATGFTRERPGGAMVDNLIASASLPCARCGYPAVDATLRWHPRIHVSGPLAELELGPASRNISGARRAGDRLISALR